ncbi:MAG: biotin/lipoyl-containing protein [Chloroflexota bacterium]
MPEKITMPQLGESVVDGTVGEWLKQVGDTIEEFEPIVRVSTDKVDTEIPAPADGILLEIYVQEGETVDAGVPLGLIGQAGESSDPISNNSHTPNGVHTPQAEPVLAQSQSTRSGEYTGHVTPVVARMAREHNLDLNQIDGTGREGRIRKKDVLAYLESNNSNGTHQVKEDLAPWEIPADGNLFRPSVNYEADEPQSKQEQHNAPVKPQPQAQKPVQAKSAPVPQGIHGELVRCAVLALIVVRQLRN